MVQHPADPLSSSLVIDLTIDTSRASLAHRLAEMAREEYNLGHTYGWHLRTPVPHFVLFSQDVVFSSFPC